MRCRLPRTVGFGAILLTATTAISFWCQLVQARFHTEHPDGFGPRIAHFFWDCSWVGIVVAIVLTAAFVVSHARKWDASYEVTYYFGLWLLVLWLGAALVGMEVAFVPWFDPRGAHY
jgi:hypothetical protein